MAPRLTPLLCLLLAPFLSLGAQQYVSSRQVREADSALTRPRFGDTVRVAGRAVLGSGILANRAYVQDTAGAVLVDLWRSRDSLVLRTGDSVIVAGVLERNPDYNEIDDAQVTIIPGQRRPSATAPRELTALTRAALDSAGLRLVTVEAVITRALLGRGDRALVLHASSDTTYSVVVGEDDDGHASLALDRFSPGDRVRVTGVLTRRTSRSTGSVRYNIYPRELGDLAAIGMSAATRNQLIWGSAFFVCITVLGVGLYRVRRAAAASRRQLEDTLRESAERYRSMVEHAPAGIVIHRDGQVVFANPEFARIVAAPTPESLRGVSVLSLVHPEEHAEVGVRIQRILADNPEPSSTRRLIRLDGTTAETEVMTSHITYEGADAIQAVVHDAGERRLAARALEESEVRFRLASRATNDVIWDWCAETDVVIWGDAMGTVFGHSVEDLGRTVDGWRRHVHPDDYSRVAESLKTALAGTVESWQCEYRFQRRDGSYATVLDRGYILRNDEGLAVRMVGALQDLSERIQLESQLRQSQKMEAVGQLAAGIAHDFNNLLTVISTYSELALEDVSSDSSTRTDIEEIQRASARAAGLTRQLLSFSRRDVTQPVRLDMNAVVEETARLLRRTIGEQIHIETTLAADHCTVLADRGQMEQVLMNLVLNARDAMAEMGGTLTIETSRVGASQLPARARASGSESCVLLTVRDTGPGMKSEDLARVFEPFFTTKPAGEGTGLGLATVYGIVTNAGGTVWAESTPNKGAVFYVVLPLSSCGEQLCGAGESVSSGTRTIAATILLVEDEAPVRISVARMLSRQKYVVVQAKNATDALILWQELGDGIDAVVTDVVMPGMRGPELVGRLRQDRPGLPVLFMSGYTDQTLGAAHLSASRTAFIGKPFALDELAGELRHLLKGEAGHARLVNA